MEDKKIIFGRNPVLEYIKNSKAGSGLELFLSKTSHGKIINTIISEAGKRKISISYREKNFFSKLGSSSKHQGVALHLHGTQKVAGENDILENTAASNGVLVLLDQLTDPQNVGSIIRTAESLGCTGVIIPKSRSAGINPTVIKASAGATAHINITVVPNAAAFLKKAKDMGFWIIGTSDHGNTEMSKLSSLKPAVVIIGSEGEGMRHLTEERCDCIAAIPLKGKISSLNASVAAGIVLYEIMK